MIEFNDRARVASSSYSYGSSTPRLQQSPFACAARHTRVCTRFAGTSESLRPCNMLCSAGSSSGIILHNSESSINCVCRDIMKCAVSVGILATYDGIPFISRHPTHIRGNSLALSALSPGARIPSPRRIHQGKACSKCVLVSYLIAGTVALFMIHKALVFAKYTRRDMYHVSFFCS